MASLVIKNLPNAIHRALKAKAKANHRSMIKEAVSALEKIYLDAMDENPVFMVSEPSPSLNYENFKPVKLKTPSSERWLNFAKHSPATEHPKPMKLRFKVTDESFMAAKRKGLK